MAKSQKLKLGAFAFLASAASAFGATAAPLHFVYEGAGCKGAALLPVYEALLGRKVDGAVDFFDYSLDWPKLVGETMWATACWKGKVSNLAASVPLAVNKGGAPAIQLADIAAGKMDDDYKSIAKSLIENGFPNAYVRLGWEFNGGWYPWRAAGNARTFISAWRHVVTVMRHMPHQHFKFVWNPNLGRQQVEPDQVYPGDNFVDVIAVDAYNSSWKFGAVLNNFAIEPLLWNDFYNQNWGVKRYPAFAKAHNKPYAFPEWGTGSRPDGHGGGDDPKFVENMKPLVQGALFEGYWDYNAGDYNSKMTDGTHPETAAAFSKIFSSSKANIQRGGGSWRDYQVLPVSCVNCQAAVVQNGPSHWNIIVWSPNSEAFAMVAWNLAGAKAEIVEDITGKPLALGLASSAPLQLQANQPAIIAVGR